ncbi:MAG: glycoside hydrolase family 130 protein [Streptosporangiaceae bacterium]
MSAVSAAGAPPLFCAVRRLGTIMEPDPRDEHESAGVLNPATAHKDGQTYLFARIVAAGNVSRVGRAAVRYDEQGRPRNVERLGVVLQPEEPWERTEATGGIEDPRITFLPALSAYLMTYCVNGPLGPRLAIAASEDLVRWRRLGPVSFDYEAELRMDLNLYTNKDGVLIPEPVVAPDGRPAYAMLHRPTWDLPLGGREQPIPPPPGLADDRPGIWISYAPLPQDGPDRFRSLTRFGQHRLVAVPEQPWEQVKIGAGPPPVATPEGWLLVYHGVSGQLTHAWPEQEVRYAAGAMLLDHLDPSVVLWRTAAPLLEPQEEGERLGLVPNVVFPTALDPRGPGHAHLYYGMADSRIGVADLRWSGEPPASRPEATSPHHAR